MENKAQFLRGCARTLVLRLLSERPMYGYELAAALGRRSEGVFALGQGTLYPLLYSLEGKGLIRASRETSADGRRRRYYALTPAGRAGLEADLVTWQDIARGMRLVLGSAEC
ncbi:MAG TPA: helix-turn-helix transcriptional regulator [Tepidisphaeraceae bacterium]|jgi:PadR family transcriptional regulator PadR